RIGKVLARLRMGTLLRTCPHAVRASLIMNPMNGIAIRDVKIMDARARCNPPQQAPTLGQGRDDPRDELNPGERLVHATPKPSNAAALRPRILSRSSSPSRAWKPKGSGSEDRKSTRLNS